MPPSAWYVLPISLSTSDDEGRIVPAPKDQHGRLMVTEPFLPGGVRFQIILIIKKEIRLDVGLAGLIQKIELVRSCVRIESLRMRRRAEMPVPSGFEGEKTFPKRGLVSCAVVPESAARRPERRKPFFVSNRILDDDGLCFFRMVNCHPHS